MRILIFLLLTFELTVAQRTDLSASIFQQQQSSQKIAVSSNMVRLGELKAFPTAHGHGAYTQGGRGGTVIEVNNMNASGAGSLQAALDASGKRVVYFNADGIITSNVDFMDIDNPDITILGQTAPDKGVTIKDGCLQIEASQVIVRHLRVRPGSAAAGNVDALRIYTQHSSRVVENAIADHLSLGWSQDENVAFGTIASGSSYAKVTVQHTLNHEPLGSPYAMLLGKQSSEMSVIRNLFAHSPNRVPEAAYGFGEEYLVANNLIYNHSRATVVAWGTRIDVLNNGYKVKTTPDIANMRYKDNSAQNGGATSPTVGDIFRDGNIHIGTPNSLGMASTWDTYDNGSRVIASDYEPFPADSLESRLLNDVGATAFSNAVDDRIISEYNTGTGVQNPSSETVVGGYPSNPTSSHPVGYDSDDDYVSDAWELEHGISNLDVATVKPTSFTIGNLTFDNREYSGGTYIKNGVTVNEYQGGVLTGNLLYTWREIFWFDLAKDFETWKWND